MDPRTNAAYAACRRLQLRHDPTYYWATRRLPADVRPATHALYGYVRTADQIVDGPRRPPTPAARRAALDAWEDELHRGLAGGRSHPVVGALVDAGERHRLPLDELGPYMRSMRVDCGPVRIRTYEELEAYMDGSAGSVGRIMAPLLGVPERFHADFGHLGQAFQLANFIRDVREDWEMDRIYVPADEYERLGVGEQEFGARRASPALRALMAQQVARARALFAVAEPAVSAAPATVRSGIRLASAAYGRILDRAEAAGGDVLSRRIGVRVTDLPRVLAAVRR
ncbi:MAG TPA: phytoene/squalene synthase family protein [Solirubrobacteraceae bacterium]|nr:phytoene/squalene synthase family protein [Solirubrobacteraceae bacterium]